AGIVGMAFETELMVLMDDGVVQNTGQQALQVGAAKKRWRAAAQMNFPDDRFVAKYFAVHGPFLENRLYIGLFDTVFFCNALVTGAERTEHLTERQVDIQTDAFLGIRLCEAAPDGLQIGVAIETAFVPVRDGGIAGVA